MAVAQIVSEVVGRCESSVEHLVCRLVERYRSVCEVCVVNVKNDFFIFTNANTNTIINTTPMPSPIPPPLHHTNATYVHCPFTSAPPDLA
jgi:hypothetical protein